MGKYSAARDLDLETRTRWYLVANRVEAVIFGDRPERPFEFVTRLSNPKGKQMESDLDSDRPGRLFSSARGSAVRHSLDQKHIHHEQVAAEFAVRIGKELGQAAAAGRFRRLVVVAEPHFLGLIRKALPAEVSQLIEHEINKEFHEGSDTELRAYIQKKITK